MGDENSLSFRAHMVFYFNLALVLPGAPSFVEAEIAFSSGLVCLVRRLDLSCNGLCGTIGLFHVRQPREFWVWSSADASFCFVFCGGGRRRSCRVRALVYVPVVVSGRAGKLRNGKY